MNRLLAIAAITLIPTGAFADAERLTELKEQIREIAIANIGNLEDKAETRALLEPLVEELSTYHSPAQATDDLELLEGAWKELFSDDEEPEPPGFRTDRDTVYQVVTKEGYFYNLSNLQGFITVSGILRGEYTPAGEYLNITFTDVSTRLQKLADGLELFPFVQGIESGKIGTITPPGNNTAPNGPVGARGNIRNIYIDEDFRVATGENFADGIVDLFVLDKVDFAVRYLD